MKASLAEEGYGVTLLGEALGRDEAEAGSPFVGKAGLRLTRLLEWAGFDRKKFDIYNAAWCRPPDNKFEGQWFEKGATSHCQSAHWGSLLSRSKVVVPMGNVPTAALLGFKNILTSRGYIYPGSFGQYVIPTVHPSFIQRGQSRWSAAFIADVQKAVRLSREGLPPQLTDYCLDPLPSEALAWAREYEAFIQRWPLTRLAFDIETPGKGDDEDDLDIDGDAPDRTWNIERIGFSYKGLSALSVPWSPPYMAAIRILLGGQGDKIVWNAGFDVPRVRHAGVAINGTIHDGMVAWHILHSDLPKRLGFVATFTCPWQPAWKHLSGSRPAYYNATDADVELRSMEVIEKELRAGGLWGVYQRDVLDLEPILNFMSQKGMPIDADVRLDRAKKLAERQTAVRNEMESSVPLGARKIEKVFVNVPKDTTGLLRRPGTRELKRCSLCGAQQPRKDHFKRYVKKQNPCADGVVEQFTAQVEEFYRLAEFTPSRDQLIRYHAAVKRPLPMKFDKKDRKKKVSFGEEQIRELILKYPDDKLYGLILDYRSLDKIAGTYVGRPSENRSN